MGYGVLLYIWCLPSPTISFLYIGISIFHIFLVTSLPKPRFPNRIRRSPGHAVSSTGVPLTDQLVDALAGTNEGVTFPPWIERRDRREIYGRSMGNLWEIYGKSMENLWNMMNFWFLINGHATGTDWLEVPIPYIFGLFFRPKFQGISPQNMALNGTVPQGPEIQLI